MTESFKTMNIGNMPKLPEMPIFTMPDNLASPNFDIAPPTFKPQTSDANANADFDKTTEFYFKPPFITLPDYSNEAELKTKFKALHNFNRKLDLASLKLIDSSFFIIRSNNIDDIHKVGL